MDALGINCLCSYLATCSSVHKLIRKRVLRKTHELALEVGQKKDPNLYSQMKLMTDTCPWARVFWCEG